MNLKKKWRPKIKRFTETSKWDDPWFRSLPGHVKLAFLYIIDRCDNAGFWEVDLDGMQFQTKLSQAHCEGALKALERGIKEASGWVWVKNFLRHQKNDPINPENPAHRQIIALLKVQSERFPETSKLLPNDAPSKGLPSPIGIGKGKGQGKGNGQILKPTREEISEYILSRSLTATDAEWLWEKWEGNGFKNAGKPIKSWKATINQWQAQADIFPSQKSSRHSQPQFKGLQEEIDIP